MDMFVHMFLKIIIYDMNLYKLIHIFGLDYLRNIVEERLDMLINISLLCHLPIVVLVKNYNLIDNFCCFEHHDIVLQLYIHSNTYLGQNMIHLLLFTKDIYRYRLVLCSICNLIAHQMAGDKLLDKLW